MRDWLDPPSLLRPVTNSPPPPPPLHCCLLPPDLHSACFHDPCALPNDRLWHVFDRIWGLQVNASMARRGAGRYAPSVMEGVPIRTMKLWVHVYKGPPSDGGGGTCFAASGGYRSMPIRGPGRRVCHLILKSCVYWLMEVCLGGGVFTPIVVYLWGLR
jgi:hypothetical protein